MATKTAPGELELVRDFVNSVDLEGGSDEFRDPSGLAGWLAARRLIQASEEIGESDRARAVELREALRDALVANHDLTPNPRAMARLNQVARNARLVVRFEEDGRSRLEPDAVGFDGALGRLLAIAFTSMAEGMWDRLKICRRDKCRWAFYDHSKNRSGNWCSMASCGNKEKAAAFRRRHSASSA